MPNDTKTPLILAVERIIDEKLSALSGVTRSDVLEIVRAEFAAQLGGEPVAPVGDADASCRHKNFMRKCESCQARKVKG